jgi:hypothetical protein
MRRGVSRSGSGLECGAWGDPDDRGDARQAGFAGKTAVPIEPIDLPGARNGSLLDAAMAVVEIGGALKAIRIGIGKRGPDLGAQARAYNSHERCCVARV